MSKKTINSSKHSVEEPIKIIGQRLEERVDYFMGNIDEIVRKYREYQAASVPPTDLGSIAIVPEADPSSPAGEKAASPKTVAVGEKRPREEEVASGDAPQTEVKAEDKVATDAAKEEAERKKNTYYVTVTFPDNRRLIKQLQLLKTEAYELVSLFDSIHDWISISIPELNSEDIPGAPVMLAVVEQVSSLSQTLSSVRSMEQKYYMERAQLEKAVLKVPESRMLQMELLVSEEGWWIEAERAWRVLIRCSLLAYTMLARNMERLKEPNGVSTSAAMYYQ